MYPNQVYMQANAHGFPSFACKDIYDVNQIKAYFGKTGKELDKVLHNAKLKIGATDEINGPGDEDEG